MDNSNFKNSQFKMTYQEAKEKAEQIKSFYISLIFYLIVNAGLVYIWYEYSSHSIQWFWFPIVGWGLGLLFKALNIYDINVVFGKQWKEQKIKQYLAEEEFDKSYNYSEDQAYEKAKKKVDSIKGFYSHLFVYLLVNIFIVTTLVWNTNINWYSFSALSTPIFWGIGLASHGIGVFGRDIIFGKKWEDQKIKDLMEKEQQGFK